MTQPTLFPERFTYQDGNVECNVCDDTIVTSNMKQREALALAENTHKCGWRERVGLPKLRDI